MVQAAAQAQAVVAAAKNRGGGLVPMNSAQISALSQIQAQAIVNARPQTALLGGGTGQPGEKPTPQQIQNQVQLQAQALVHAHTQAQIAAGIYKGGDAAAKPKTQTNAAPAAKSAVGAPGVYSLTPTQLQQQTQLSNKHTALRNQTTNRHATERTNLQHQFQHETDPPTIATQSARMKDLSDRHAREIAAQKQKASSEMAELHASFRKQAPSAQYSGSLVPRPPVSHQAAAPARPMSLVPHAGAPVAVQSSYMSAMIPSSAAGDHDGVGGVVMSATSPEFLSKLNGALTTFWSGQLQEMRVLGSSVPQTEQDFKNHNDLPLARIKRIMKSDEDVRMISAEAPVLFAKACEMFILELTLRSWHYSENNKRKTLQKEDIREAIQRTDIFDFLVDVIH